MSLKIIAELLKNASARLQRYMPFLQLLIDSGFKSYLSRVCTCFYNRKTYGKTNSSEPCI